VSVGAPSRWLPSTLAFLLGVGGVGVGCGPSAPAARSPEQPPSTLTATSVRLAPERYRAARADWRRRGREARAVPPEGEGWAVTTSFAEGWTGRRQSGRGALAVLPPDRLRLQVVGPAGKLALDVWVGPGGSRVASPLLQFVERAAPGELKPGRPTGFLTFWMLHRFGGRLLAVTVDDAGRETEIVRGTDGALIEFTFAGDEIVADRHTATDHEHVDQTGGRCGTTHYTSKAGALSVDVQCTGPLPAPKPRAFVDPDADKTKAPAPSVTP
jgi:hypothetical protein